MNKNKEKINDDLISVEEILKATKEAEEEYKEGKLIEVDSLAELLDDK